MARVVGPLMSIEASGTYAKTLTFGTWKGRPYVRERVIPANPKTAKQLGVRAMMGFLARAWASLGSTPQGTWAADAAAKAISAFNQFVSANLTSWQSFSGPTQSSPAAETSDPLTVTDQTLTGGHGQITIEVTPSGSTAIWGIAIFRDTAEITATSWANCIAILDADGANPVTWVDSPLDAGTYHYRSAVFNVDGVLGTVHADATATAT